MIQHLCSRIMFVINAPFLDYFAALTFLQVQATIETDKAECLYAFSSNQVFIHNSVSCLLLALSMVSG